MVPCFSGFNLNAIGWCWYWLRGFGRGLDRIRPTVQIPTATSTGFVLCPWVCSVDRPVIWSYTGFYTSRSLPPCRCSNRHLYAANVFFVIIPGQRAMVDDMTAGREPNPDDGAAGALRSLHNNYLTLPVLFIMISTHYPSTYSHPSNWLILAAIMGIGALTRHWFNLRGQGHQNRWILPMAAIGFIAVAVCSKPESSSQGVLAEGEKPIDFYSQVYPIVLSRCTPCHGTNHPLSPPGPPKGLVWETPASILANINEIERTALTKDASGNYYMPLGNITQMTEAERDVIRNWIRQGTPMGKVK